MAETEVRHVTMQMIANELDVPLKQVTMWYHRRAGNGFPETLGRMEIGEGPSYRREARVWDLDAVIAWREAYTPRRGGRPKGT